MILVASQDLKFANLGWILVSRVGYTEERKSIEMPVNYRTRKTFVIRFGVLGSLLQLTVHRSCMNDAAGLKGCMQLASLEAPEPCMQWG